jgi:hypothetical protein
MRALPATAFLWLAAVLAASPLAGCDRREASEPPLQAPAGPSVAERVKVLNADVLVIDGRDIRLADAVAPQPIPDARCWAEALASKLSVAAVRDLVRSSSAIRVEPTGRRDEHNREIARVVLDNQDLGRTLHDMGFAAETAAGHFGWCGPLSAGGEGAPDYKALMDFSRG